MYAWVYLFFFHLLKTCWLMDWLCNLDVCVCMCVCWGIVSSRSVFLGSSTPLVHISMTKCMFIVIVCLYFCNKKIIKIITLVWLKNLSQIHSSMKRKLYAPKTPCIEQKSAEVQKFHFTAKKQAPVSLNRERQWKEGTMLELFKHATMQGTQKGCPEKQGQCTVNNFWILKTQQQEFYQWHHDAFFFKRHPASFRYLFFLYSIWICFSTVWTLHTTKTIWLDPEARTCVAWPEGFKSLWSIVINWQILHVKT